MSCLGSEMSVCIWWLARTHHSSSIRSHLERCLKAGCFRSRAPHIGLRTLGNCYMQTFMATNTIDTKKLKPRCRLIHAGFLFSAWVGGQSCPNFLASTVLGFMQEAYSHQVRRGCLG